MIDIVSAESLPAPRGVALAVPAQSLKNFRQPKNAAQAKSDCRAKNALVYMGAYELDDGSFSDLAASGGALVFSFSDLLHEQGFRRSILLSKMRLCLAQCRRAGCGFVACTLAQNENELRNAREIRAFMAVLGMGEDERKEAERSLERLAGV